MIVSALLFLAASGCALQPLLAGIDAPNGATLLALILFAVWFAYCYRRTSSRSRNRCEQHSHI